MNFLVCSSLCVLSRLLIARVGRGSNGTTVFKGSLGGQVVAVKRLLQDFVTLATHEINILKEAANDHPNVIQYFCHVTQPYFIYLVIQLCPASLADIIERRDSFREIEATFEPKRALREITSGLRYLHARNIIHRDIKPQNIMVSGAKNGENHRMLISDFGLCKRLEVDQASFMPTDPRAVGAGTVGWRAPEILRKERRLGGFNSSQSPSGRATASPIATKLTRAVDIFALGCLFYYCLTRGGHPYGNRVEREGNIMKDAKNLEGLGEEDTEVANLIEKMLNPEAALRYVEQRLSPVGSDRTPRPDTTSCLVHPFFWNAERRLAFLQDVSDKFEAMRRNPQGEDLAALEANASNVFGQDWMAQLDKAFQGFLIKRRTYNRTSVQDLLRALRNGVSRP